MFNFFKKPKQTDKENQHLLSNSNFIIFSMQESDTFPTIKIMLNNVSDDDADNFGLLLYFINNGLTQATILELLADISKQSVEANVVVQRVLSKWLTESNINIKNKKLQSNEPLIKPTNFNSLGSANNG